MVRARRLEVCFEIKGSGEVDGDILNKFHGVHFGDEIESDDLPEPAKEEVVSEETSEGEDDTESLVRTQKKNQRSHGEKMYSKSNGCPRN